MLTKVRAAAAENGFYTIDTVDVADGYREGHDPELVEKALAGVEGVAAAPIADLIAGRFPTLEDRFRISMFVAVQHVRGPGYRADMNRLGTLAARTHLAQTVTDERIQSFLEARGEPAATSDVETFREEALGDRGPTLVMSQPFAVQESLRHAMDYVLPRIYFAAWKVIRFSEPILLTSDAPVAPWAPTHSSEPGIGIMNAKETYLPLDRSTALVVTANRTESARDTSYDGRASIARRINDVVARSAERWFLHHPDQDISWLLPLPARAKIVQETTSRTVEPDGTVRLRGMYRRPSSAARAPHAS